MSIGDRRVVVTGIGLACGLGQSVSEFGENLFAGRSCIVPLTGWKLHDERYRLGGQFTSFDMRKAMPEVDSKRMMRFTQFSMVAAKRAIADARLDLERTNRTRIGTSFSTSVAGLGEVVENDARKFAERGARGIAPTMWNEFTPCASTTQVAMHFGLQGPLATQSSGCVGSIDALLWGVGQIRLGTADVAVVGGADTMFSPFLWAAITRSGMLAQVPDDGGSIPRPFSDDHNGLALAEGGSAIIVESVEHARLRGARIYGEIAGITSVESGEPLTKLDPNGAIFAYTIRKVLADAGLPPTQIDWVCAHGTGHPIGDGAESRGIETALGEHAFNIPVSSIRGAVGQSFASGGGFQLTAACLAITQQRVPPTINFHAPAEGCHLDYVPNVARIARVKRVLINSAGIGGVHSGVVVSAYED